VYRLHSKSNPTSGGEIYRARVAAGIDGRIAPCRIINFYRASCGPTRQSSNARKNAGFTSSVHFRGQPVNLILYIMISNLILYIMISTYHTLETRLKSSVGDTPDYRLEEHPNILAIDHAD